MFVFHLAKCKKYVQYLIFAILLLAFLLLIIHLFKTLLESPAVAASAEFLASDVPADAPSEVPVTIRTSSSLLKNGVIVVDAGHGEPDGGAVSSDGVKESDLNLQIALKLEEALLEEGFDVIMTREDENNIAPENHQSSVREMKVADIDKRIEITNASGADMLISIHMNKFSATQYHGWQTFYQKNSEESKRLAESIQEEIKKSVQRENNRTALKIENIKLMDNAKIPAVIVECGFLSNEEEKNLLQQEAYQNKLVTGIVNGILNS